MDLDSIDELSLTHHTAISFFERLGIDPSQEQIDLMEAMVRMATYPKLVTLETIKDCVGGDTVASFFLYLKNKDLRS